jgi:Secretory lipase
MVNDAVKKISLGVLLVCLTVRLSGQDARPNQASAITKRAEVLRQFPLTKFYDTPIPLPAGKPGELIRSAPFEQYVLSSGVQAVRILYYSRSANGDLVATSGVVLFPDEKPPAGGWPVIAWAHKLTGVGRSCAPSLARNMLHGPFLSMYVHLGYAVVATDYTGLGTSSRNAFADARSNAMDVIDSIPAAQSAVPGLSSRWIAMGTGEGSMATLAVAELENKTPDPNYLGSVAISRIADLEDLLQPTGNQSHDLALLLAYGVKTVYPEFDAREILTGAALPLYEQVGQACGVPEAGKVAVTAMLKAGWEKNKFVQEYFDRNRIGMEPANAPMLVISSEGDPLIIATTKVVARLCKRGDHVWFNRYGEYDAGTVIGDSVRDQMAWIQERFSGRAARSNCSKQ